MFLSVPNSDIAAKLKLLCEESKQFPNLTFFLPFFFFQIENYLLRNHETRKYLQEQAYRLQQGIVTSTTQQVRIGDLMDTSVPKICLGRKFPLILSTFRVRLVGYTVSREIIIINDNIFGSKAFVR